MQPNSTFNSHWFKCFSEVISHFFIKTLAVSVKHMCSKKVVVLKWAAHIMMRWPFSTFVGSLWRPLENKGADRAGFHILLDTSGVNCCISSQRQTHSKTREEVINPNLFQPEVTSPCTSKGHKVHTAVNDTWKAWHAGSNVQYVLH